MLVCVYAQASCYKSETFSVCYRCPKVHDRLGCLQYTFPTSITSLFLFLSVLNSLSFSFSHFPPSSPALPLPPHHSPICCGALLPASCCVGGSLWFATGRKCADQAMKLASILLPNCLSSGTKGFTLMSCRDDSQNLMLYMRTKMKRKMGTGII